jgi:heptaprenyl diphosphate synthase
MKTSMSLMDIYEELREDIQYIEQELYQSIYSSHPVMKEASAHLLKAGGKRIRPVFVLLGGKNGTYDLNRLKYVAVALELVHMATLVHDDVIDDAAMRRGQLTVRSKWDNRVAMYTGNFILAQALECISKLENNRIHKILSKVMIDMCIGEMEQIKALFQWDQSIHTYLRRIKRKTALLMAVSCQLGALACRAPEKAVQALYRFGYYVGMAFQITDDVLDFTGTEQELGKPAGSDLLHGNITYPVLVVLENEQIKSEIMAEFVPGRTPDMKHIISLVKSGGGIMHAKQLAHRYLEKAREAISDLEDPYSKKTFANIAEFIEQRTY